MKDLVEIKTDFNGMELPVLLEKGLHQTEGTFVNGIYSLDKSGLTNLFLKKKDNAFIEMELIGISLGYKEPNRSMHNLYSRHKEELDKHKKMFPVKTKGGEQMKVFFDKDGCYRIAMFARTKKARQFRDYIISLINNLPEMFKKAFEMGQQTVITQKQIENAVRKVLNEKKVDTRTFEYYTCKQIGKMLGKSAMDVSSILFKLNLHRMQDKNNEWTCKYFYKNNGHECYGFKYSLDIFKKVKEFLEKD